MIAGLHVTHVRPDCLHNPSGLVPKHDRSHVRVAALHKVKVTVAKASGRRLDKNLAWPRFIDPDFAYFKITWNFVKNCCLHTKTLSIPRLISLCGLDLTETGG
jgi:hypothetical protein